MTTKIFLPVLTATVAAVAVIAKKTLFANPKELKNRLQDSSRKIMANRRVKLDYAAQFSKTGESYSELDKEGNLVIHPATAPEIPTVEEAKSTAKKEAVTESIEVLGISDKNIPEFIKLGTGEGEIKPFSKEYKKTIRSAYRKAEKNPDYRFRVEGKTYGLGARGKTVVINDTTLVEYDAKDLKKLVAKIES